MADVPETVLDVIDGYIQENGTLDGTMAVIHKEFTGDNEDFTRWAKVPENYTDLDWTEERIKEFVQISKKVVEAQADRLSEAYFEITAPQDLTNDVVEDALESINSKDNDEVLDYSGDSNIYQGRLYYAKTTVDIADYRGEFQVDKLENQRSVDFRINIDQRLLVVEETASSKVRKVEGIFNNVEGISVEVCGDLTTAVSRSNEIVSDFKSDLEGDDDKEDIPTLRQITEVHLYNKESDEEEPLKAIDYEGVEDIYEADTVKERREDDDWAIRGLKAELYYQNGIYDVTVSGKSRIGYVKIEGIDNMSVAIDLLEWLRSKYMENFRLILDP